jgi:molybdopterin molybdotransferase
MIRYSQALEFLKSAAAIRRPFLSTEKIPIELAVGRLNSHTIHSPESIPSFDNSSMDGFALHSSSVRNAQPTSSVALQVLGTLSAGSLPVECSSLQAYEENKDLVCWEIMTGAPIPSGFDAVVKIEDVEVQRDAQGKPQRIWLQKPLHPRENFRGRGEDFKEGQLVVPAGHRIMPEQVLALASLGLHEIEVFRKPRIAVVSTGSELQPPTQTSLFPGMIRNSTGPHLMSAFPDYGVEAKFYGIVTDDPQEYIKVLQRMRQDRPDVIVSTGAVSRGKYDFVAKALMEVGAKFHFHQVAIRPGKPGLFAELPPISKNSSKEGQEAQDAQESGGPVVFGVPGNPVSTAVSLRFFIRRYLEALTGVPEEKPFQAQLTTLTEKPDGLRCFFKAQLQYGKQGGKVSCLKGQSSFMVSPLLEANAWVVFPEEGSVLAEGTWVDVYPLHPLPYSFFLEKKI